MIIDSCIINTNSTDTVDTAKKNNRWVAIAGIVLLALAGGCFLRNAIMGPRGHFPEAGDDIILGSFKNLTSGPVVWDDRGLVDLFTTRERRGIDPQVKEAIITAVRSLLDERGYTLKQETGPARRRLAAPQKKPAPATKEEGAEVETEVADELPEEPQKRFLLEIDIVRWDVVQLRPAGELEAVVHFRLIDDMKRLILWEDANRKVRIRGDAAALEEWNLNRYMEEIVRDAFSSLTRA